MIQCGSRRTGIGAWIQRVERWEHYYYEVKISHISQTGLLCRSYYKVYAMVPSKWSQKSSKKTRSKKEVERILWTGSNHGVLAQRAHFLPANIFSTFQSILLYWPVKGLQNLVHCMAKFTKWSCLIRPQHVFLHSVCVYMYGLLCKCEKWIFLRFCIIIINYFN